MVKLMINESDTLHNDKIGDDLSQHVGMTDDDDKYQNITLPDSEVEEERKTPRRSLSPRDTTKLNIHGSEYEKEDILKLPTAGTSNVALIPPASINRRSNITQSYSSSSDEEPPKASPVKFSQNILKGLRKQDGLVTNLYNRDPPKSVTISTKPTINTIEEKAVPPVKPFSPPKFVPPAWAPPPNIEKNKDSSDSEPSSSKAKLSSSSYDPPMSCKTCAKCGKEKRNRSTNIRKQAMDTYLDEFYPMPDYDAMSEKEKNEYRLDFKFKFGLLAETFPNLKIQFKHNEDLKVLHRHYVRYMKHIDITNDVNYYKVYIILFILVIEGALTRFFKLGIGGITMFVYQNLTHFNSLFYELGEKNRKSKGSEYPVEIRIIGMFLFIIGMFVLTIIISNYMGPDLANLIRNNLMNFLLAGNTAAPASNTKPNSNMMSDPPSLIGNDFAGTLAAVGNFFTQGRGENNKAGGEDIEGPIYES